MPGAHCHLALCVAPVLGATPETSFLLGGLAYFLGDLDLPVHGFRGSQHQITRAAAGCPGSAACQSSSQGFARASPGQPPAGPKLRPAFPWCSVCFATRKSHSFVCHLAPSHSAHPFKRTSFPRPQALLPFSAPIDYVLAGGIFKKKCFVVCEQIELFGEGMDFTEAMCVEFLLYYVFNMVYPGSVATTLEFIQRQLFNINPLSGTKCDGKRKSGTSVNVKVMKLAQALRMIL
ncbi:uncharacterized protein LOC144173484 [Haemaphysalis longicornis]